MTEQDKTDEQLLLCAVCGEPFFQWDPIVWECPHSDPGEPIDDGIGDLG